MFHIPSSNEPMWKQEPGFNYECPVCGGKFNFFSYINKDFPGLGACPFCFTQQGKFPHLDNADAKTEDSQNPT